MKGEFIEEGLLISQSKKERQAGRKQADRLAGR